jgi:hypothetical protein
LLTAPSNVKLIKMVTSLINSEEDKQIEKVERINEELNFKLRFLLANIDPITLVNYRTLDIKESKDCTMSVFEYKTLDLSQEQQTKGNKGILDFLRFYSAHKMGLTLALAVSCSLKRHVCGVVLTMGICIWLIVLKIRLFRIDSNVHASILRHGAAPVGLELAFYVTIFLESLLRIFNFKYLSSINFINDEIGFNFQNSLFLFMLVWVGCALVYNLVVIIDSLSLSRKKIV